MSLTREAILAAEDLKRDTVPVPEWGDGAVATIRMMTAAERMEYLRQATVDAKKDGQAAISIEAILVAMSVCDESGALLFKPEDIPALAAKSATAISRIANAAAALNEIAAGRRKAIAKN